MNVGAMGYATWQGYPSVIPVGGDPQLLFEVFGPGHLRCSESCYGGFEIRAGRIRALSAYDGPKPVKRLLDTLQARVLREVCSRVGDEILKHDLRVKQSHTSLYLFSRILNTAAGARKGGAFVFLPDSQRDAADYGIKISNRTTSLDIGADLTENWISYLQSLQQFGTPERESTMQLSEVLRAKLMTKTDAVGHFSHVDGCVVMTQEFKVLGFGAKIDAPVTLAEESPRRFKHIVSEEVYTDSVFMAAIGGTRHQSAARLCQIYPGMIVFTLSQDGDLKPFTSDEQFAYAYGPLDLPTIKDESMV